MPSIEIWVTTTENTYIASLLMINNRSLELRKYTNHDLGVCSVFLQFGETLESVVAFSHLAGQAEAASFGSDYPTCLAYE